MLALGLALGALFGLCVIVSACARPGPVEFTAPVREDYRI